MGVDVASFGDYEAKPEQATPLVFEDPFRGVYKKLLFSPDGTRLLGGILVGDASRLRHAARRSPRATSRCPVRRAS